jgi:putative intracellular protease/amidase
MAERTKAVIVLTSHDRLGNTERKTGFHWEELATPYYVFLSRGFDVEIASIRGGMAPADPGSLPPEGERPASVERFLDDRAAMAKLRVTRHVDEVRAQDYALFFLPGGHGTMWDLPEDRSLAEVLTRAWRNGSVIGAVCHGPAGLLAARGTDGRPLVAGRHVSAFTDAEERAVGLDGVVPFLLESRLGELGAVFEAAAAFEPKLVRDGRLVTGQNPASAKLVADEMIAAFAQSRMEAA